MKQYKFYRKIPLCIATLLLGSVISTSTIAASMQSTTQSYAQFTAAGELVRLIGYRGWIFIGAPITPNDMNNGKAAFPEFHNVYIDPASWAHWKKTGEFRDGTLIVKELVSVGSKQAASGNSYFQGEYIGLEASVKSKKHFSKAPGNWGYFRFTVENSPDLLKTSMVQPDQNCLGCHQARAAQDQVFTQYYPVLRAAAGNSEEGTGGR